MNPDTQYTGLYTLWYTNMATWNLTNIQYRKYS